jgi:hypothetical protein
VLPIIPVYLLPISPVHTHPDLLPQEKEQPQSVFRFAVDRPVNSVAQILMRRRTILLLLGREGRDEGERFNSSCFHHS